MARLFQSSLQSQFGAGPRKDFESVVLEGQDLWHWRRDHPVAGHPWRREQLVVLGKAAFPGSIIQSDFGLKDYGNFEVVVPLFAEGGAVELWHYRHDPSSRSHPWTPTQQITKPGSRVVGPASIIQSDLGSGDHGAFEVVVPELNRSGIVELRHYRNEHPDRDHPWSFAQRVNDVTHEVLGSGCIIQSHLEDGAHGLFEVAAWVRLPDGRSVLQHYWRDPSDPGQPWSNGQVIIEGVEGNGVLIQSGFGAPTGNFEVVVPIAGPGGRTYLSHVWRDNRDVHSPWRPGQIITEIASENASASLFQSDLGSGAVGNFEVLVEEGQQSLVDYWHPNLDVNLPWIRHSVLIPEPPNREIRDTVRICQLTGEYDRTGWNGVGQPPPAFNRTETRSNVHGTDLGVSFEHQGRVYFLFGDTWRIGETHESHFDWDAVAYSTDTEIQGGLSLTFHERPPLVPGISQGAFEVPLDGFSHQGRMYGFFSTDHRRVDRVDQMGRSVLAVSDNDGYDFEPLVSFSRNKFINVSVELASLDPLQSQVLNWPEGAEVLWIWGSGRYRMSPVYLAAVDLSSFLKEITARRNQDIIDLADLTHEEGPVRFFAGTEDHPLWSIREPDAAPLFCAGDVGELSARRNSLLNRYFLTYNAGNPRGIVLRHAPQPWGPWSENITIFDPFWGSGPDQPIGAGYGTFMHLDWNVARVDHVQDDAWFNGFRDHEWGGEYGPYQITRLTTGQAGEFCFLYYTMSTWNPYQSMLMRTLIRAEDLF